MPKNQLNSTSLWSPVQSQILEFHFNSFLPPSFHSKILTSTPYIINLHISDTLKDSMSRYCLPSIFPSNFLVKNGLPTMHISDKTLSFYSLIHRSNFRKDTETTQSLLNCSSRLFAILKNMPQSSVHNLHRIDFDTLNCNWL